MNNECWHAHDKERTISLLSALTPKEGFTLTALDGVKLMRWNRSIARSPVFYEPSIVFVCQGRKVGYLGGEVYQYNPQQFLILSVPLPFESETIASPDEPLLAISIRINLSVISELLMSLEHTTPMQVNGKSGIISTALDKQLSNAVVRLLECLQSKTEAAVLGQAIIREIHYRLLTSAQSSAILAAHSTHSNLGRISKALRLIHAEYANALNVDTLAAVSAMSVPSFHAAFRDVTATSPIQYLKKTRLHKARLLMVQDGMNATLAATKVGYESASQFSREFKRMFGRSPMEEVSAVRTALITSPSEFIGPHRVDPYVTVQQ
ncbi:AraC family transcriptional regulator [Methylophilus sp. 3sh_L]|uniref:AraC family transcriptional regulator n=1 Tax=Methylophilus sp. 3sh_L TaxID=3377114 RepID=UPI00398F0CB3